MGAILVFDLDGTIAGNYVSFRNTKAIKTIADIQINPKLLNVLKLADAARTGEKVDAIFLLTNNSDNFYIFMVQYIIGKLVKGVSRAEINAGNGRNIRLYDLFDDIMSRNDNRRPRAPDGNPPKRLIDVQTMVQEAGLPIDNLSERTWFFDDIPDHQIKQEIPANHYIHVNPSYTNGMEEDTTNIRDIEAMLTAGGGKKKRQKTRKTHKLGKKSQV